MEEQQIVTWLSHFGEVKSKISEDTHGGSGDSDDDLPPVGNGIYSVKMKLTSDMPQLIPMHGKRIRLYYRGITKRCTNCFGTHQRKNCKDTKVLWITYVEQFMKTHPEIPKESYGRWSHLISETRPEKDADRMHIPKNQEDQTITTEDFTVSKHTKDSTLQVKQVSKKTIRSQIEKENERESRNGNDDETGSENETENETEDSTKEDEINQLVQKLLAAGITPKILKNSFKMGEKEDKTKQRGLSLGTGRGRGRGKGRGKES